MILSSLGKVHLDLIKSWPFRWIIPLIWHFNNSWNVCFYWHFLGNIIVFVHSKRSESINIHSSKIIDRLFFSCVKVIKSDLLLWNFLYEIRWVLFLWLLFKRMLLDKLEMRALRILKLELRTNNGISLKISNWEYN